MKKILLTVLFILSVVSADAQELQPKAKKVTQYSTYFALSSGLYNSNFSIATLSSYGNMGFGTYEALDGEMVLLNGSFFQIMEDGAAFKAAPSMTTPFATVCFFNPKTDDPMRDGITMKEFISELETSLPSTNMIYAFTIDAKFRIMITRSVPKQLEEPYLPLSQIVYDKQKTRRFLRQRGTIVGFYFPKYLDGVNVSGCHMHFIASDKKAGGHVLDFTIDKGRIKIDEKSEFEMILPETPDFKKLAATPSVGPEPEKKPVVVPVKKKEKPEEVKQPVEPKKTEPAVVPIENKKEQPEELKQPVEPKKTEPAVVPIENKKGQPEEIKQPVEAEKKAG